MVEIVLLIPEVVYDEGHFGKDDTHKTNLINTPINATWLVRITEQSVKKLRGLGGSSLQNGQFSTRRNVHRRKLPDMKQLEEKKNKGSQG